MYLLVLVACIMSHVCVCNTHTRTYTHTHTLSLTGLQHVPVGPLTAEQEALAKIAFHQSSQPHGHPPSSPLSPSSEGHASMGMSGAIHKHTSSSHIKAFSGKGHTLSSSGTSSTSSSSAHTPFSSIGHTLFGSSVGHTLSSDSSSFGVASESGASRAGPSGPGRGGVAGRGRFISSVSSAGGDGVNGGSRLAQRTAAVEREDLVQADGSQVMNVINVLFG